MQLFFKEWLLSTPDGAGEIWDDRSNSGHRFGQAGVKSKYVASDAKPDRKSDFDPDKLFLGKHRKKSCKKIDTSSNLGGIQ